jgi:vacuolar protein sorting-associated protein VTA1
LQPPQQPQVVVDDEAIAKAQKHARWAISALNYEDVETAVKELKNALNTLGVRN